MASGYVKIYGSILGSSIWAEESDTRIVWITMLAMADAEGKVEASESGLARFANVTVERCRAALRRLADPDLDSKSPEYGGRRVEKVDGGWLILNYLKYREMRSPKQVAAAERQRAFRERNGAVTGVTSNESHSDVCATVAVAVDESVKPAVDDAAIVAELSVTGIWIARWANAAIAERWGEQVNVLRFDQAEQMAADLVLDGVSYEVVRDSIGQQCRKMSKPPSTPSYFLPGIRQAWQVELSRRDFKGAGLARAVAGQSSHGDPGSILVAIKHLAVEHQTQGSGIVRRIARQEVAKMGERVLAAFDAVGGAESILGANGQSWGFLVRDFGKALHG